MSKLKTYATHFCGFGGACHGIEKAGLQCVFAIDSNHDGPAVETRLKNVGHQAACADIVGYPFGKEHACDVLWSSPPCQTFSTSAREQSNHNPEDERNCLFEETARFAAMLKPRFCVIENVTGLLTHLSDYRSTLVRMIETFDVIGYKNVECNVINAAAYGLPQERERVFIIAALNGETGLIPFDPPLKKKPRFGDIIESGSASKCWAQETYATALGKVSRLIAKNGSFKIKVVGAEDILPTVTCGWGGGATRKKVGIFDSIDAGNRQVNFLRHPTLLEGLRAQGFPDEWMANLPKSESLAWNLIGNSVPSPISEAIIKHLQMIADGKRPRHKTNFTAKKAPKSAIRSSAHIPPFMKWA